MLGGVFYVGEGVDVVCVQSVKKFQPCMDHMSFFRLVISTCCVGHVKFHYKRVLRNVMVVLSVKALAFASADVRGCWLGRGVSWNY